MKNEWTRESGHGQSNRFTSVMIGSDALLMSKDCVLSYVAKYFSIRVAKIPTEKQESRPRDTRQIHVQWLLVPV